jgi:signal transduction histidine kinase
MYKQLLVFLFFFSLSAFAQNTSLLSDIDKNAIFLSSRDKEIKVPVEYLNDTSSRLSFEDIQNLPFNKYSPDKKSFPPVQWLKFYLKTTENQDFISKISIIFTDKIQIFAPDEKGNYQKKETGDLLPASQRDVEIGQMAMAEILVRAGRTNAYFIRLESQTAISRQFRQLTLQSVTVYPEKRFKTLFIDSRIYQSLFYGAIFSIILYNLFLYISLRNQFLLYYILFTLALVIFLASNNGYLAETILNNYPRIDLYIRFLSTPVLLIFYSIFSKSYLQTKEFLPVIDKLMNSWIVILILLVIFMGSGQWFWGRSLVIYLGIANFLVIASVAFIVLQKGFTPARFFLAANSLFIISGILYALQRINVIVYDPLNQYQTQLSSVLQVALLSLGLADRIQLIRKELAEKTLENERIERRQAAELKRISDEKNEALQKVVDELDMFIYRTAHDIRGPLARLLGLSQIALLDVKDVTASEYIHKLDDEAKNLNYILARLSKVYELKHTPLKKESFQLYKLIEKIIEEEKKKNIHNDPDSIDFEILGDESLNVISDLQMFDFFLRNLIENTIRFRNNSENSFVKIAYQSAEGKLIISVTDNGIGISPQYHHEIFDMFSRAAGIHKTAGLGLYMSRIAIEKLNGNIRLADNPKGFTEFRIEI